MLVIISTVATEVVILIIILAVDILEVTVEAMVMIDSFVKIRSQRMHTSAENLNSSKCVIHFIRCLILLQLLRK